MLAVGLGWAMCHGRTVGEVGVAELQVLARAGGVGLRAHGKLHVLDVLFQGVEGTEYFLHPIRVVERSIPRVGLHALRVSPRLLGRQDGQRLDDLPGGALRERGHQAVFPAVGQPADPSYCW